MGGPHGARKSKRHGDEDGVGQVGEDDGESSRRSVRRVPANDSKVSRLGGRSNTHRHRRFNRFGLKTGETVSLCGGVREGWTGLTSKPGETGLTSLGLKTGGGLGAAKVRAEDTSRHREACVEVKRSREGGVSVRCLYKKMDEIAPVWACIEFN